eukprot:GHVP01025191.1.p1 GENE.GHVP01025191.1~~GHVP01025191.1.p1  ORF type:complete len:371 (+),score=21.05 GHVP01025191.1:359-1471(+)
MYLMNKKQHTHIVSDNSLLSPCLQPLYNNIAQFIPPAVRPNQITVIGILTTFIYSMGLLYKNPSFSSNPNPTLFLLTPMFLFFSMLCDSLDGIHARRTDQTSPLGHFLDHGLDSLNCTFISIIQSQSVSSGKSRITISNLYLIYLGFIASAWEEYYTGVNYFGFISGPTEGIVFIMVFSIISYFGGASIWDSSILGTPITLNLFVIFSTLFLTITTHISPSLTNVYKDNSFIRENNVKTANSLTSDSNEAPNNQRMLLFSSRFFNLIVSLLPNTTLFVYCVLRLEKMSTTFFSIFILFFGMVGSSIIMNTIVLTIKKRPYKTKYTPILLVSVFLLSYLFQKDKEYEFFILTFITACVLYINDFIKYIQSI